MPAATRALLTGLIDYAGLFPPAALSMREVVANYATYLASPDAWMLGRLVVPAARLIECHSERSAQREVEESALWRISALVASITEDAPALAAKYEGLDVDSCELKAPSVAEINAAADAIDPRMSTFVEIPVADDPAPLLDTIAARGLNAKVRTGGVTPDAFPSAAHVARFLIRCRERGVAFKATAGLHHPLRGSYRLTYADNAPSSEMFGFLNVSAAASVALANGSMADVERALLERTASTLADPPRIFFMSFGSCSFREPVDDLAQIGVL